jgi:hypothetical protein
MTEDDWLRCATKPKAMLPRLGRRAAGRRLQLLACAVCRLAWDAVPDPACRAAVAAAARLADGLIEPDEFQAFARAAREEQEGVFAERAAVVRRALDVGIDPSGEVPRATARLAAANAVLAALSADLADGVRAAIDWVEGAAVHTWVPRADRRAAKAAVRAEVCRLIREVFGSPFRVYRPQPGFAGGGLLLPDGSTFHVPETARAIADGAAADQAFDRLPIVADALEDAGCPDRVLLDHLRHGTGHVRGCWAVDAVLGRG